MSLGNNNAGMRAGNPIYYSLSVITTIYGNLSKNRQATFRYSLTSNEDSPYPSVGTNQMNGEWVDTVFGAGLTANHKITSEAINLPAGLNRSGSLWLKMAFVVKAHECYAGGIYCEDTTIDGSNTIALGEIYG